MLKLACKQVVREAVNSNNKPGQTKDTIYYCLALKKRVALMRTKGCSPKCFYLCRRKTVDNF